MIFHAKVAKLRGSRVLNIFNEAIKKISHNANPKNVDA